MRVTSSRSCPSRRETSFLASWSVLPSLMSVSYHSAAQVCRKPWKVSALAEPSAQTFLRLTAQFLCLHQKVDIVVGHKRYVVGHTALWRLPRARLLTKIFSLRQLSSRLLQKTFWYTNLPLTLCRNKDYRLQTEGNVFKQKLYDELEERLFWVSRKD